MSGSNIKLLNAFCTILVAVLCLYAYANAEELDHLFAEFQVVPDVIPLAPQQPLKITYSGDIIAENGVELTPTQVRAEPEIEWAADPYAYYTLIMTDPDAPSRAHPKFREFRHWLVGNIPGAVVAKGEVIAAYVGSGPPKGTGLHRYVFLMYKQPNKLEFDERRVGNNSRLDRPKFRAADFAKKYNLGTPVAGNFYQARWDEYVPTIQKQLSGGN